MVETDPRLVEHREQWKRKPTLRAIYEDYHVRIRNQCRPGNILEIGAGSGHMAAFTDQEVVSLDILVAPWLDLVADAQQLPFRDDSLSNIVMLDVLHHIPRPTDFFVEAIRVLRPGGRLVMIEPAITLASWPFLHFAHPEPVDLRADPLDPVEEKDRDPFDSNQAIPTLLFKRKVHRRRFEQQFPKLRIVQTKWLSLMAYPLSGGFRPWSLLPARLVPFLLKVESFLMPVLGPLLAFRLLVVLERFRTETG